MARPAEIFWCFVGFFLRLRAVNRGGEFSKTGYPPNMSQVKNLRRQFSKIHLAASRFQPLLFRFSKQKQSHKEHSRYSCSAIHLIGDHFRVFLPRVAPKNLFPPRAFSATCERVAILTQIFELRFVPKITKTAFSLFFR